MAPQYVEHLVQSVLRVLISFPLPVVAYFTQESLNYLRTIDDFPQLSSLNVPPGKYKTARSAKSGRPQGFDPPMSPPAYPTTSASQSRYPSHGYEESTADHGRFSRSGPHQMNRLESRPQSPQSTDILAPLAYLQNIPPPRRHPMDVKALMSFTPGSVRR